MRNKQVSKIPELISLFCGPGGLDEGFRQAGFLTRVAFDIDPECVNTFNRNHGNGVPKAFVRDLRNVRPFDIANLTSPDFHPTGIVGGPPCQSFSFSNVHQTDDDPRHNLPQTYASLLAKLNKIKPISFFVFENVPALLGKTHIHRYEKFKTLFYKAGFEINERILNAKDFGVPQQRERVFIVGINRMLHPSAIWHWPTEEPGTRTVRDTIGSLPEPIFNVRGMDASLIPIHPNHWCMVPKSRKFSTPGALIQGQSRGRSFRTLNWDEPSWTVAYGNREVHVHPKGHRRLSMYEAMLLQSFPKDYVLTGNISAQIRLVSEAVSPRMAWHLAAKIRECLKI